MILVTGGTGLLGSYLVRLLVKEGFQVRVLHRRSSDLVLLDEVKDKIEFCEGDILDVPSLEEAMQGVEKVYHSAAYVAYNPSSRDMMFKINVEGTTNVVNCCLALGVKKLMHVSSVSALGKNKPDVLLNEETKWEGGGKNSVYGETKFLAENEVYRGMAEGLDALIVLPTFIVGAGKWSDSTTRIFKRMDEGNKFYSEGTNGYVDVRDLVTVMYKLMEGDIVNDKFIIHGENVTYYDMLGGIAKALGKEPPKYKLKGAISHLAWITESIRSKLTGNDPTITKELVRLMQHHFYYDNSKVKEKLGYEFRPMSKSIKDVSEKYLESKAQGTHYATLEV